MGRQLTHKARAALTRIAEGDGDATQHTTQMVDRLAGEDLITFDLDLFKYIITDRGRAALAGQL